MRRSVTEGVYRGVDGLRSFLADNAETFESFKPDYTEHIALDDGRVLSIGTTRVRGRGGGVELDVPSAVITEYRDGRVSRFTEHGDVASARAAAGLDS